MVGGKGDGVLVGVDVWVGVKVGLGLGVVVSVGSIKTAGSVAVLPLNEPGTGTIRPSRADTPRTTTRVSAKKNSVMVFRITARPRFI